MQSTAAKRIPSNMGSTVAASDSPDREKLFAVLRALRRGRWGLLLCAALSMLGAEIYCQCAPVKYTSHARLEVHPFPPLGSQATEAPDTAAAFLAKEADVMKTTVVLQDAVEEMNGQTPPQLGMVGPAISKLRGAIVTSVSMSSHMILLSTEESSPNVASAELNAVMHAYADHRHAQQSAQYAGTVQSLENEKENAQRELDKALAAMAVLKRDHAESVGDSDGQSIMSQKIAVLSKALADAHFETIEDQLLTEMASRTEGDPEQLTEILSAAPTVASAENLRQINNALDDLTQKRSDLQQSIVELNKKYGPSHEAVHEAYARLASLESEIETTCDAAVDGASELHAVAQKREEAIRKSIEVENDQLAQLAQVDAEYDRLNEDASRYRHLLDDIQERINAVEAWNVSAAATVMVLEPAVADDSANSLHRNVIFLLALTLGLGIGGGLIAALELLDGRFKSAAEIFRRLHLPVMGSVPQMPGEASRGGRAQEVRLSPGSRAADAFRQLMATVLFRANQIQAQTILITSPSRGDGRTTLAANLAIACAQTSRRVLLVDADCRNPSQHHIFNLNENSGLSGVLLGTRTLETVIQSTDSANLDVVPCGPMSAHTAGLLHGQPFSDLLAAWRRDYDLIILEACAVNSASDAQLISAVVDATLLVFKADQTTRKSAELARCALVSAGAKIMGVAVNCVPENIDAFRHRHVPPVVLYPASEGSPPIALRKAV
jgi:polysaccharide biosynthesis transport protein